jgi:hypothetical protein
MPVLVPATSATDADRIARDNERLRAEKTSLQQEVMELKTRLAAQAAATR